MKIYAETAPLPATLTDHLFRRFAQARTGVSDAEKETLFVSLVVEKRRETFTVMDPYVRSRNLTRAWLMDKLTTYGHPVTYRTLMNWQQANLVEMEGSSEIKPLSAQALLVAGMIDTRQRGFLPPDGVPVGETWHCYIQRSPDSEIESCPVGRLNELPPATLCWSANASAYWQEGWRLIGESEGFIGCMRFAGTRMERGLIWYSVSIDDIRQWDADVAALYTPQQGNTLIPIQNLCRPLFDRLAQSRLKG